MRRIPYAALAFLAVVAFTRLTPADPLPWKPVANAFLRVNDEGLKEWGVFQIEKKTKKDKADDRFLVQLADRFLLVDAAQRKVFDLTSANIQRSGPDALWDAANLPAKPLNTSEWLVRDVGLAQRIKMHLDAEDRTLDLQIPHRPSRP